MCLQIRLTKGRAYKVYLTLLLFCALNGRNNYRTSELRRSTLVRLFDSPKLTALAATTVGQQATFLPSYVH